MVAFHHRILFLFATFFHQTITASYNLWFNPGAPIALFTSTLTIPPNSPNPNPNNDQAVWSGLQPSSAAVVLQNVVDNDAGGPENFGSWPFTQLGGTIQVYPGSTLQSTYFLNPSNGQYTNDWYYVPGPAGQGSTFASSAVVDPSTLPGREPFTQALFSIEIQGSLGAWDFGPVVWSAVSITAQTTDTGWCNSPTTSDGFQILVTNPRSTFDGGLSTCSFDSVEFRLS
ncbi:hypothetical protein EG329_007290 [Mollisiaceae sp. DMI_Dod_QoI]|nr:hypothetical protein EG329_007290 [Helotiales sp. DMI_Dod_QoI]